MKRKGGASKFFSGSAKAILFMTSIDIAGGIAIGYFMQEKGLLESITPAKMKKIIKDILEI